MYRPGGAGASAYNNMGSLHLLRGRPEEAREAYRGALRIDALNGIAHDGLANILILEGKIPSAPHPGAGPEPRRRCRIERRAGPGRARARCQATAGNFDGRGQSRHPARRRPTRPVSQRGSAGRCAAVMRATASPDWACQTRGHVIPPRFHPVHAGPHPSAPSTPSTWSTLSTSAHHLRYTHRFSTCTLTGYNPRYAGRRPPDPPTRRIPPLEEFPDRANRFTTSRSGSVTATSTAAAGRAIKWCRRLARACRTLPRAARRRARPRRQN